MNKGRELCSYEKTFLEGFKKRFYQYVFEIWEESRPKDIQEIFLGAICRLFDLKMAFIAEGEKKSDLRVKYMYPERKEIKKEKLSLREESGSYDDLGKANLEGLNLLVAQGINSVLFIPIKAEREYLFMCNRITTVILGGRFTSYDITFSKILYRYIPSKPKGFSREKLDKMIYEGKFQRELGTIITRVVSRYKEDLEFKEDDISEELQTEDEDEIKELLKEARESIDMWFMPIVSLINRQTFGYEMLARDITKKTPGFPKDIFARAGTLGKDALIQLDCLCIKKVFDKLQDGYPKGKFLFINIYPDTIYDKLFEEILKGVAEVAEEEKTIISPWFIVFEITETGQINNCREFRKRIEELLYYHVSFADDDHGSGQATNARLLGLKLNYIKIGGDFIINLLVNGGREALVRGAVVASRDFGARAIAENIEIGERSEKTISVLKEIGVSFGQGYLFGEAQKSFLKSRGNLQKRYQGKREGEKDDLCKRQKSSQYIQA